MVESSVSDTTTSPDEVGAELPLDTAGSELPLAKFDAETFPEDVEIDVLTAIKDLDVGILREDATLVDHDTADELEVCMEKLAWVVDTVWMEEAARVECTAAEEVTIAETVQSVLSKKPLSTS